MKRLLRWKIRRNIKKGERRMRRGKRMITLDELLNGKKQ